ncbi:hypothetical protein ABID26_006572 [Mesorhizobium shonense]|uniref:Uncharacterized protein n=1 Tax=Mesorhizobium shonense TaxID=1209948 RepID=A0ABV2I2R9_9HYPH|nr:hypothetical protein [Mesorhizobium sp.]TIS49205.1 MAG: hypothetical protein E5W96_15840 [Mesorhizobium sp.]
MIDVTGPALIAINHRTRGLLRRLLSKEHRRASSDLKIGLLSGVAKAGLNDRYRREATYRSAAETCALEDISTSWLSNAAFSRPFQAQCEIEIAGVWQPWSKP